MNLRLGSSTANSTQDIHLVEEDMDIVAHGYKPYMPGTIAYWALVACTAGMLYVVDSWFHVISIWLCLRRTSLDAATFVHVCAEGKHLSLETVESTQFDGPLEAVFGHAQNDKPPEGSAVLPTLRVFAFRHYRFAYNPALGAFVSTSTWKDASWDRGVCTGYSGLCEQEIEQRRKIFGPCIIDIEEKSYGRLLWEEVLNPFYIFQAASIIIWCNESYYYYAACIFAISVGSIIVTLISTKKTARKLKQMSTFTCPVRVLRASKWRDIESCELVPGDIFDLSDSRLSTLPCEAVVLEGDCIVNESMLSGESVPESKLPLEPGSDVLKKIDLAMHTFRPDTSRHIIFAGTQILRVRPAASRYAREAPTDGAGDDTAGQPSDIEGDVLSSTAAEAKGSGSEASIRATAMVLRTGFHTTKGTLVRSILFPRSTNFRFYSHAFKFIGILAFIAIVGFIANTVNLHRLGVSAHAIALKALDLITVTIPPAMPMAATLCMTFAARRLLKKKIFCISPSRINVASKVAVMCFDKTGTLTEEGLDLLGVRLASQSTRSFVEMHTKAEQIAGSAQVAEGGDLTDVVGIAGISAIDALATCHSLRLIDDQPVGDPLEVKMLEFTGWQMEENESGPQPGNSDADGHANDEDTSPSLSCSPLPTVVRPPEIMQLASSGLEEIGILKCFEFSPELRRASVVAKRLHGKYASAYAKGAPEVIQDICDPDTLPADFDQVLSEYTQQGYRVIALAGKPLRMAWRRVAALERHSIECDLNFMGFMVFENKLKPETAPVLDELRNAKIRQVMVTGDSALTAVSVGRECCLIAPGVRVFVSQMGSTNGPPVGDTNKYAGLAGVAWKDSMGSSVVLDPASLVPRAVDPADLAGVQLAEELAQSGGYCLAVTGDAFRHLHKHIVGTDVWKHIMMRGAVFARMSPEQKAELIHQLQSLGYITGFAGDGANDCSALKSADIGISLSEAEASVAAPFTSQVTNIACVPQLIKEGRCSIATSFSCFKYMALYSMIQFTTCCVLYTYNANLTDGQFLFVDLFTIIPIAVFMDRSKPYKRLVPKRPSASLISKKVITSLIGNIILVIGFQIGMYVMTESQPWYQKQLPEDPSDPDSVKNEGDLNTSMFLFTMFQYLFIGMIFNSGKPYREPSIKNYGYMAVIIILALFDLWVLLVPVRGFFSLFGLMHVKVSWRFVIFGMVAANFVLCYLCERFLFPRIAVPLAKIFRLLRIGLGGCLSRVHARRKTPSEGLGTAGALGSDKEDECMAKSKSGTEELGMASQCVAGENSSSQTAGLWTRLGHRENRKEYKLILEKMAGGSSWY
ncbi:hypothetical protein GGI12_000729 [Dipsacomyces acuminosporus]|nr:hypothetical protein GGI12_000729 [Dipsacomyces acuminosporus]